MLISSDRAEHTAGNVGMRVLPTLEKVTGMARITHPRTMSRVHLKPLGSLSQVMDIELSINRGSTLRELGTTE